MRSTLHDFSRGCLLALAACVFGTQAMVFAQDDPLGGSVKALEAAYTTDKRMKGLLYGDEQPKKEDVKSAETAANYFLWRITHPKAKDDSYIKYQNEFKDMVSVMMEKNIGGTARKNRDFINMFGVQLVGSMKRILERDVKKDPTTVINAAMMLPTMAKLRQDDVGDYLIDLVKKGGTHDVVRLYALRALKDFVPFTALNEDSDFGSTKVLLTMKNDAKYVDELSKYITRPIAVKNLPEPEILALHYLRREAIASLGNAGAPAVLALKKPVKLLKAVADSFGRKELELEGLVAPTLFRVLANDLPLAPTLQEKLEAAHGVCKIKYDGKSDYNADLAVYLVGRTLQEFVSEYNKDWGNFAAVGPKKALPMIGWKAEARQLETSLGLLKAGGSKGAQLDAAARPILTSVGKYERPDNVKVNDLATLVQQQLRPTNLNAFKTIKSPIQVK